MLTAAGAIAFLAGSTPSPATAQRGQQPGADAVRILIATFRSPANQGQLGVDAAEAVRSRVQQENSIRQVWVLPRQDINNYLTSSGYKADSALSPSDLKELAKLMRADEIVDGSASRTANGVRVDARLILSRDISLAQPLPPAEAKDVNAAARQIARDLAEARKQLPDYRRCETALREQKYPEAATAARASLAKNPNAHLSRLCLLSAFYYGKMSPDSVIRTAEEVLKADSLNRIALGIAQEAFETKGDTARSIQTLVRISRIDPSVRPAVITKLGAMNKPDIALPLLNEMLQDNPGDPQLLRTKWLLLLAARQWKAALTAGEEYVKADTSAANVDYYSRSIVAALQDSQPQLASQIGARGVQKFATNADLQMLYAQALRRAGQLQQSVAAAQRAVQINPKIENGVQLVIVTFTELNMPDSAIAWAKQAVAAGADKPTIGQALLPIAGAAMKAAQDTAGKTPAARRQAWVNVYQVSSRIDSVASSEQTQFFIAVSSFSVGLDALQSINASRSCTDAQLAEDMWAASQIAMPKGAKVDPNTAGTIMSAIQQYSGNITQAKKVVCKSTNSRSGAKSNR